MMDLSVVVITKNEERNIGRCLESVAWADEIIVVDSGSTDRTREIAVEFGASVFSLPWRGYGCAKRDGVEQARGTWILSIDADEVVPEQLAAEIRQVIHQPNGCPGYNIPRRTNFLGRWIRHCGWYPDPVLRLFRRDCGNFDGSAIHEKVILNGRAGRLSAELLHYSYPSLETYLQKFDRYTTAGAREAFRRGKRARWYDIVVRPPVAFVKHFISHQGFRDGIEGFIISIMSAVAVLIKYAKLRHRQRRPHVNDQDRV